LFRSQPWISKHFLVAVLCFGLAFSSGCGFAGSGSQSNLPQDPPQTPDEISPNPQDWVFLYSSGVGPNPYADPAEGDWAFDYPYSNNTEQGHVNYLVTPFQATKTPQEVIVTFEIEAQKPVWNVFADSQPPTVNVMFEVGGDCVCTSMPYGRWWGYPRTYVTPDMYNQVQVVKIPIEPSDWSSVFGVNGQNNPSAFWSALKKVSWFGLTFGGFDFAGHGVALDAGSAKFVLISYQVDEE
jgi:hypothetical protein